jgi:Tol biopolymer transport system component
MAARWILARFCLLAALIVFAASPCLLAEDSPKRLPNQIYNRMVYVRTIADRVKELFVNMPNHFDLGSPSISPDGKQIAFDALTVGPNPVRETWLVDVDGNHLRKLVDGAAPRWSPDGKRLLITGEVLSLLSRTPQIHISEVEVATGKKKPVREGRYADWSPDGKRIVFSMEGDRTKNSGVHPGSKLWTAAADGSGAAELCDGDWPSWSPDSKKIAFCVQKAGKPGEIWVIDLDTKKKNKIGLGHYRAQWLGNSKGFVCNGSMAIPDQTTYTRAPARFLLDRPIRPIYFGTEFDNPWSPCISRDGKVTVFIVDSQKQRGMDDEQ